MSAAVRCSLVPAALFVAAATLLGSPVVPAEQPVAPASLEPFEVTGSRIKRTDFEGVSPMRIITRTELELSSGDNLVDILRGSPEATGMGINEGDTVAEVRGASAIDLRSLGPGNTLILVDGRRQAPNGISALGAVFVDPNRFPWQWSSASKC